MTTTLITKATMQAARIDLDAAFAELTKKHKIIFSIGNGTYAHAGDSGSFKLTLTAIPEGAEAGDIGNAKQLAEDAKLASTWKQVHFLGLKASWLGATFTHGGKPYKIVGYNSRKQKQPIALRSPDGRTFFGTTEMVIKSMTAKDEADATAQARINLAA
jgi:hypothetical protein